MVVIHGNMKYVKSDAKFFTGKRKCSVAGWGTTTSNPDLPQKYPNILHRVKVPLWDTKKCRSNWIEHQNSHVDEIKHICAGEDGKDNCSVSTVQWSQGYYRVTHKFLNSFNCFWNDNWWTLG